jgi:polar amino acid transport system substrate-binding protein
VDLAAPEAGFDVTRVDDWHAHLEALLPGGAYDVSFPWLMPDCRSAAALDDEQRRLCSEFSFSRPLLEAAVGFYVRAGDPLIAAVTRAELAGKRLCRPAGHFLFDLQQTGMTAPLLQLEAAPTAADCFARLLRGDVDMVTLLADEAERALRTMGGPAAVAEAPGLRSVHTVHAIALKGNLRGEAALAAIDRGVERLMLSGGWFDVVAAHRSRDHAIR